MCVPPFFLPQIIFLWLKTPWKFPNPHINSFLEKSLWWVVVVVVGAGVETYLSVQLRPTQAEHYFELRILVMMMFGQRGLGTIFFPNSKWLILWHQEKFGSFFKCPWWTKFLILHSPLFKCIYFLKVDKGSCLHPLPPTTQTQIWETELNRVNDIWFYISRNYKFITITFLSWERFCCCCPSLLCVFDAYKWCVLCSS